jgi:hypothetical protein
MKRLMIRLSDFIATTDTLVKDSVIRGFEPLTQHHAAIIPLGVVVHRVNDLPAAAKQL